RPRLGELPGDAADLDHRRGRGERQHDRHLEEDAEEVADVVGRMLGEALGAIAALEQEGVAGGDLGELGLQLPRLAGKYQRREPRKLPFHLRKSCLILVDGNLLDRLAPPAVRLPCAGHLHTRTSAAGSSFPWLAHLYAS